MDQQAAQGSSSRVKRIKVSHDYTNTLDAVVLAKIISYLPLEDQLRMEKISDKWREASQLAWFYLKSFNCSDDFIRYNFKKKPPSALVIQRILSHAGRYIKKLSLSQKYTGTSKIMLSVTQFCNNLTELELEYKYYHMDFFINAFSNMKNLKSFKIYIDNGAKRFDYQLLESLPTGLEKLTIASKIGYHLTHQFLPIYERLHSLRFLELIKCGMDFELLDEMSQKNTLTHFAITKVYLMDELEWLSNLQHLEYLSLYRTAPISSGLLEKMINNNIQTLSYLNICSLGSDVKKKALVKISDLENLKELNVSYNSVDDEILSKLGNLKKLDCANCWGVSDIGAMGILQNSPELERLNVSDTKITIQTLNLARDITKDRKNNVKLHLLANPKLVQTFLESNDGDLSPFLVLQGYHRSMEHIFSDTD